MDLSTFPLLQQKWEGDFSMSPVAMLVKCAKAKLMATVPFGKTLGHGSCDLSTAAVQNANLKG